MYSALDFFPENGKRFCQYVSSKAFFVRGMSVESPSLSKNILRSTVFRKRCWSRALPFPRKYNVELFFGKDAGREPFPSKNYIYIYIDVRPFLAPLFPLLRKNEH